MTSSRLMVLCLPALLIGPAQAKHGSVKDPVQQRRELEGRQAAHHVLGRLAFGARPGDVDAVTRMGIDRWIERQLDPRSIPDPRVENLLAAYPTLGRDASALAREFPPPNLLRVRERRNGAAGEIDTMTIRQAAMESRALVGEVMSARVARAVVSERQLQEVLTDFWLNHFSVFVGKNQQMRYHLPSWEREVIRPHTLGRFRDLLGAVAKHPAMLIYLDNAQSVADSTQPTLVSRDVAERRIRLVRRAIARNARANEGSRVDSAGFEQLLSRRPRGLNENYARELLELHTLGVDGGYTQQDVIEVARALTGWTVRPLGAPRNGGEFAFNPVAHDAGAKTVLGHRLAPRRGIEDGEQVLDIVARHPATARHVARKLAVRFVSDSPPPDLVDRAAQVFERTDGDLREVVRTIVTSPEFFSRAAYRSKVKSPFETVVSALRALGSGADTTAVTAMLLGRLGQPVYGRQSPDGWPETGSEWMNTGAILNRINFGMGVAAGRLPGVRLAAWPPYAALRGESREAQVEGVIEGLLGGEASPETRGILESGNNPLAGVPDEPMEPRRGNRRGGGLFGEVRALAGLDQIVGLALGSPEFQRR
jgi:uncharacterized protein (DUF1800 family)